MVNSENKSITLGLLKSYDEKTAEINDSKYVLQADGQSLITSTEKSKLSLIENKAQVNKIDSISVDNVPMYIDNRKNVNIDLSGKVDKVNGKSLVLNTDIAQINLNKEAIEKLNGDASTIGSVANSVLTAINNAGISSGSGSESSGASFNVSIVDTLPSIGAVGTIYLIEKDNPEDGNKYNEYIWVSNKYELLGNEQIDLDDYVTTDDIDVDTLSLISKDTDGNILFDGDKIFNIEANPEESSFTDLEKIKINDAVYMIPSGGTDVYANPTGETSGDLSSISIGGVLYNIKPEISVQANPSTASTETLNKIRIDNTIYAIEVSSNDDTLVEANPTNSSANTLKTIKIGETNYQVYGSQVSYRQLLSSGYKIGSITIDNNEVDIYVPETESGTTVEGNVSGTTTQTLNNIKIGDVVYKIGGVDESSIDTVATNTEINEIFG